MVFLTQRRELEFILESTPGTAEATTTGSNSNFIVYNLKYNLDLGQYVRSPHRSSIGQFGIVTAQERANVTFSIEIRRETATSVVEDWMVMLEACGFEFTGSGSALYKTTSVTPGEGATQDSQQTATIRVFTGSTAANGPTFGIKGAMGNVVFRGTVGEPLMADFTFSGIYITPVDDQLNSVTHETGIPEPFQGVTWTYAGDASQKFSNFTLDMGNNVVVRDDATQSEGVSHAIITQRNPVWTINPEAVALSNIDYHLFLLANTTSTNTLTALTSGSQTLSIAMAQSEITGITDEDDNGIFRFGVSGVAKNSTSSADDDVALTFT